jgi:hypothetical protein
LLPDFDQYFFEEYFVLLRMPYRIELAERVVTFASHPKRVLPMAIAPKYSIKINAGRRLLPLHDTGFRRGSSRQTVEFGRSTGSEDSRKIDIFLNMRQR